MKKLANECCQLKENVRLAVAHENWKPKLLQLAGEGDFTYTVCPILTRSPVMHTAWPFATFSNEVKFVYDDHHWPL